MAGPWEKYGGGAPAEAAGPWARYAAAKPAEMNVDPTADMGPVDRLLAGTGRGMVSAARGVGNLLGLVSDADMAEAKRLDAALLKTTGGAIGNVVGSIAAAAPTMLIPGANTVLGATAIGAGLGGLTTEGNLQERAIGAASGAAGGLAGKFLGDKLGQGARTLADSAAAKFATRQAADSQRMGALRAASEAGYVIPPADLQPGRMTEALSGLSGKIKTAQVASQRNQEVTNRLAREAVGLPADSPLTADVLATARSQAGKAYEAVRGAGIIKADEQYGKALDSLSNAYRSVTPDFPGLARSDVPTFIDGLKKDAFDASTAVDAIRLLRARADQAFRTGDGEMGKAAKAAAGEIEALVERNLQGAGKQGAEMLSAFRDARQQMARTYTLQKALNSETGDVMAPVLARELAKGKPLSGDLRTIAEAAQAAPRAMQALKEAPKQISPLDWAVGAMSGAGTGNPLMLAAIAARPAVRSVLLSPAYQRAALAEASGPGLLSQMPAGLLDHEATRRLAPGLLGMLSSRAANAE